MGVDYTASFGYGFVVDESDLRNSAFIKDNWDDDDGEDDIEDLGLWDLCEIAIADSGLNYVVGGSSYSGEVWALIGYVSSISVFGFKLAEALEPGDLSVVEGLRTKLGLNDKYHEINYYGGLHVW